MITTLLLYTLWCMHFILQVSYCVCVCCFRIRLVLYMEYDVTACFFSCSAHRSDLDVSPPHSYSYHHVLSLKGKVEGAPPQLGEQEFPLERGAGATTVPARRACRFDYRVLVCYCSLVNVMAPFVLLSCTRCWCQFGGLPRRRGTFASPKSQDGKMAQSLEPLAPCRLKISAAAALALSFPGSQTTKSLASEARTTNRASILNTPHTYLRVLPVADFNNSL